VLLCFASHAEQTSPSTTGTGGLPQHLSKQAGKQAGKQAETGESSDWETPRKNTYEKQTGKQGKSQDIQKFLIHPRLECTKVVHKIFYLFVS